MTSKPTESANFDLSPKSQIFYASLCALSIVGMITLSYLPFISPWGRPIAEQSAQNPTLLVPLGFAFSIWGPIFLGCLAFALYQFRKPFKTSPLRRSIRTWACCGFIGVCVWTYFSSFGPVDWQKWGTALVFIPTMLCFVKAMLLAHRNKAHLSAVEKWVCWLPLSLIAGWTSLAVFLNWAPLADDFGYKNGLSETSIALSMLGLAVIWAALITVKSKGNLAYSSPIIWGLSFLALARFQGENGFENRPLALSALGAAALLIVITGLCWRKTRA